MPGLFCWLRGSIIVEGKQTGPLPVNFLDVATSFDQQNNLSKAFV